MWFYEQMDETVDGHPMLGINDGADPMDRGRDHSGPKEFPSDAGPARGAGIGARRDLLPFVLALDAPRQDRKQRHPPDQEKNSERGDDGHLDPRPVRARPTCRQNLWD